MFKPWVLALIVLLGHGFVDGRNRVCDLLKNWPYRYQVWNCVPEMVSLTDSERFQTCMGQFASYPYSRLKERCVNRAHAGQSSENMKTCMDNLISVNSRQFLFEYCLNDDFKSKLDDCLEENSGASVFFRPFEDCVVSSGHLPDRDT